MTKFDNLEYDIKQMLLGNYSHPMMELKSDTAHSIVSLAKNMATHTLDMVNHKAVEPKDPTATTIRMSEIGEPCLRKLMFKWYKPHFGVPPYSEHPNPYLPVKFTFGDYIEELTLFLAKESGHAVTNRQEKVELRSPLSEWYAVGHIDAMIDGVVVDVKSAADVSFNKYKREGLVDETDSFGYRYQLDGYAMALGRAGRAFIFTNKHDGELHIIDRTGEGPVDVIGKMAEVGRGAEWFLKTGKPPDRIDPKVTKYGKQLTTICGYCNFKYSCYHGNIKGVVVSGRPVYYIEDTITKEGNDYIKDKAKISKPGAFKD